MFGGQWLQMTSALTLCLYFVMHSSFWIDALNLGRVIVHIMGSRKTHKFFQILTLIVLSLKIAYILMQTV